MLLTINHAIRSMSGTSIAANFARSSESIVSEMDATAPAAAGALNLILGETSRNMLLFALLLSLGFLLS